VAKGAQERKSNGGRAAAPGNEQESQWRTAHLVIVKIVLRKFFPLPVTKVVYALKFAAERAPKKIPTDSPKNELRFLFPTRQEYKIKLD
jgi:hypothetical protein